MDHLDIIKFFDDYIKKYPPYANNITYSTFIDYFSKHYTKELYEQIPIIFKQLFEDNFINIELYDTILCNIGIPPHVLAKLKIQDKVLFFKELTDYFKYKGNVTFFDKVSKLFPNENFDIYELYIDYDINEKEWIFKPNILIKNTDNNVIDYFFDYDEIYNSIPSFLINQKQLSYYRDTNNIILPVKTNIVLLNYSHNYYINELNNLINAIFIKSFKNNYFTCYFIDNQFYISIKEFYLVWYYLLLRFYNTSFKHIPLKWIIEYNEGNNPFTINDVDNIIAEYNEIKISKDSIEFYKKYHEKYFLNYTQSTEITYTELEYLISDDLLLYIENKISASSEEDRIFETLSNSLLNSYLIFVSQSNNKNFIKYSDFFINSLTRFELDFKNSSSYTLLYNFKPYHTELLTEYISKIIIDSKLDTITPYDSKFNFLMNLDLIDNLNNIDYIFQHFLYNYSDPNSIIETNQIKCINNIFDELIIDIIKVFKIEIKNLDNNKIKDILFNFKYYLTNGYLSLNLKDYNKHNLFVLKDNFLDIEENNSINQYLNLKEFIKFNIIEDLNWKIIQFNQNNLTEHYNIIEN
jgi:hypothetical protein